MAVLLKPLAGTVTAIISGVPLTLSLVGLSEVRRATLALSQYDVVLPEHTFISVGGTDPRIVVKSIAIDGGEQISGVFSSTAEVEFDSSAGDPVITILVALDRGCYAPEVDHVADLTAAELLLPWPAPTSVSVTPGGSYPPGGVSDASDLGGGYGTPFGPAGTPFNIESLLSTIEDSEEGFVAGWATRDGGLTVSQVYDDMAEGSPGAPVVNPVTATAGYFVVSPAADLPYRYSVVPPFIAGCLLVAYDQGPARRSDSTDGKGYLVVMALLNGEFVPANVYIDGAIVGQTYFENPAIDPGAVVVRVECHGQAKEMAVTIPVWDMDSPPRGPEPYVLVFQFVEGGDVDRLIGLPSPGDFKIKWRDNDSQTWSKGFDLTPQTFDKGMPMKHLHRMGRYRTRQYELVHVGNWPLTLVSVEEEVEMLQK